MVQEQTQHLFLSTDIGKCMPVAGAQAVAANKLTLNQSERCAPAHAEQNDGDQSPRVCAQLTRRDCIWSVDRAGATNLTIMMMTLSDVKHKWTQLWLPAALKRVRPSWTRSTQENNQWISHRRWFGSWALLPELSILAIEPIEKRLSGHLRLMDFRHHLRDERRCAPARIQTKALHRQVKREEYEWRMDAPGKNLMGAYLNSSLGQIG